MVGIGLLVLLVVAVVVGLRASGGESAERIDVWTARAALVLALLGEIGVAFLATSLGAADLPALLTFAAVPLVLTAIPLVLHVATLGIRVLTVVCALLLSVYVVVTGLSIGLFFAPAAIALVQLAALRARRTDGLAASD
ncbi:hypothetical protein [Pseudonocardia xinjiangensis]|uniref:Uncharacterized protein n=1 Tax=Pseudonocardia xinjiangensis TaxID=75289 RepID=A0ABX1R5M1_9PSEU|nr:hypothetical protein [Pseudonocardia xinjiangensis]NMH75693.1 hypothetical protein [Pseudonocardia xinjiangensis]